MSSNEGFLRSPEVRQLDPVVVDTLRDMTDRVLADAGVVLGGEPQLPTVKFSFSIPGNKRYVLDLYSIADGVPGYNTAHSNPNEDNSRRWSVHIDRGTFRGSAYDKKGTVYEHGAYEPSPYKHNIDTGDITDLLSKFYDDPDCKVSFQLLPEAEDGHIVAGEPTRPRLLHRPPAVESSPRRAFRFRFFRLGRN